MCGFYYELLDDRCFNYHTMAKINLNRLTVVRKVNAFISTGVLLSLVHMLSNTY